MGKRSEPVATAAPQADAGPDFETSLARLEDLIAQLESPDLPLEQALATYEAGVALTRRCREQLESAERRIEVLVREGGRLVARPYELEDAPADEGI